MAATDMEVVETTAPAAETADENSEKHAAINKAADLLAEGKKKIVCGDLPTAVNICEEAVQLLVKSCGELSRDCADAYFYCGSALLELGRMESEVLGVALEGVEVEEEKEVESSEQFEKPPEDESETRLKLREQIYDAMAEGEKDVADQVSSLKPTSQLSENNLKDAEAMEASSNSEENKEEVEKLQNSTVNSEDSSKAEHAESDKTSVEPENKVDSKDCKPVPTNGKENEGQEKIQRNSDCMSGENGAEQMDSGNQAQNGDSDDVNMAEEEDLETEEGSSDEETAENGEKAEDIPNFQLAWEYLDLAKVLFLKSGTAEDELKAAECYIKLGELSIETEKYSTAAEDLHNALKIQQKLLPANDRKIAESFYQLGLAYHHAGEYVQSLHNYTQAIHVIESKIESLNALIKEKETNDDNKENEEVDFNQKYQDEIRELQNLIPEIKDKIEDTNEEAKNVEQMKQIAKEALGLTNNVETSPSVGEKDIHVNGEEQPTDIGHLVRKKRKPEDDPEDVSSQEVKKSRSEAPENLATTTSVDSGCTQGSTDLTSVSNSSKPEEAAAPAVTGTGCPEVKEQGSPKKAPEDTDVTSGVGPEAMEVSSVVGSEEEGVISAVTDIAGDTCKNGAKNAPDNVTFDPIVAKIALAVDAESVVTPNISSEGVAAPVVESESVNVTPIVSETIAAPVVESESNVISVESKNVSSNPIVSESVSSTPVVSESVAVPFVESGCVTATPIVSEGVAAPVESESVNVTPIVSETVAAPVVESDSNVISVESKNVSSTPIVSESVAVSVVESEGVSSTLVVSESVAVPVVESEGVSSTPVVSESVAVPVESECVTATPIVSESIAAPVVESESNVTSVEAKNISSTPIVSDSVVTPIESDSLDVSPVCESSADVTSVVEPQVVKSDSADVAPIVVSAIAPSGESESINAAPVVALETANISDAKSENSDDVSLVAGPQSVTAVVSPESSNVAPAVDCSKLADSSVVVGAASAIEPMATAESAETGLVVDSVSAPVEVSAVDNKPDESASVEPVVRNEPTKTDSCTHPAHVVELVSEVKSNESNVGPMDVGHDGTASSDSTDVEPMDTCADVASSIEPLVSAETVPVS